jgi:hypothetical protein
MICMTFWRDQRHADRGDQRCDPWSVAQWAVREPLDRDVDPTHDGHADDEACRQDRDQHEGLG